MPTIEELENKLNAAASQYEQVVKQNQSLQQELKEIKELVLKDPVSLRDVLVSECVASEYENETRNKIVEFLTEMSSQDNRGTAFPYYYTIADERLWDGELRTYYEGIFLTESDAENYIEQTRHHFDNCPRTYVDSFYRWGRHTKTEEFLKNLFEYFGVKVPPRMYYESKGVDYKYD